MIDHFLQMAIQELGPTGLLICGLYFLLGKHMKRIGDHIEVINHELGEIKDLMEKTINKRNKHD